VDDGGWLRAEGCECSQDLSDEDWASAVARGVEVCVALHAMGIGASGDSGRSSDGGETHGDWFWSCWVRCCSCEEDDLSAF